MIIIASASMIGSYIRHVAVEIFFSLFLFGSSPYFWVATSSTQHNCSKCEIIFYWATLIPKISSSSTVSKYIQIILCIYKCIWLLIINYPTFYDIVSCYLTLYEPWLGATAPWLRPGSPVAAPTEWTCRPEHIPALFSGPSELHPTSQNHPWGKTWPLVNGLLLTCYWKNFRLFYDVLWKQSCGYVSHRHMSCRHQNGTGGWPSSTKQVLPCRNQQLCRTQRATNMQNPMMGVCSNMAPLNSLIDRSILSPLRSFPVEIAVWGRSQTTVRRKKNATTTRKSKNHGKAALCLAGKSWKPGTKAALCLAGNSWKPGTQEATLCLAGGSWKPGTKAEVAGS